MRFLRKVCFELGIVPKKSTGLNSVVYVLCTGSDGAASSYHVKQLEEQNSRLKEALVRSVTRWNSILNSDFAKEQKKKPLLSLIFSACVTYLHQRSRSI